MEVGFSVAPIAWEPCGREASVDGGRRAEHAEVCSPNLLDKLDRLYMVVVGERSTQWNIKGRRWP